MSYLSAAEREGEDILSFHLSKQMREESALNFRQKVRNEAEERQRQGEKSREEKRKAAQKRREAIVERIRRKQEEEERLIRQAAEAKLKALEMQKRLEEEAIERLRADRAAMSMEDELSKVSEQLWLEQQEKADWLRQEAEKLAEWEKEQRRRDEEEQKRRKRKLLELEEKKMKLAELRKAQDSDGSAARQDDLKSARNEALKLSKQARIQNKAKFVSKRRKVKETSQKDLFSGSLQLPSTEKAPGVKLFSSTHIGLSDSKKDDLFKGDAVQKQAPKICGFEKYENLQTETELHGALKEVMAEKRGLRLQLMHKKSSAETSEHITEVKDIQCRIKQISDIEVYIKDRLDKLVTKKSVEDVVTEDVIDGPSTLDPSPCKKVRSRANSRQGGELNMSRRISRERIVAQQQINGLYHEIEGTLREIAELVLQSEVVGCLHNNVKFFAEDVDALLRRAGLLKMKSSDYIAKIKQGRDQDINGYENKLQDAMLKLQTFLDKLITYKSSEEVRGAPAVSSMSTKNVSGHPKSPRLELETTVDERQEYPILESMSVPTLGGLNTKLVHTVDVNESVVLNASGAPLIQMTLNSDSVAVKDTKWEEVKKNVVNMTQQRSATPPASDDAIKHPVKNFENADDTHVNVVSEGYVEPVQISVVNVRETCHQNSAAIDSVVYDSSVVLNNASTSMVCSADRIETLHEVTIAASPDSDTKKSEDCGILETEEKQDDMTVEAEEMDYDNIEGWEECVHTTMATAAHHAAFYGFTEVLELLSRCFDVFVMDKNGRTPLFYASLRNNFDCVLLLVAIDPLWIEVGDVKGETCMHAAVKANGVEVLEFLLTCDVDSSIANNEGLTPAHLALSFPLLSALNEAGSTLYCVDTRSRMPLWYACRDGLKENAELLCSVMPLEYLTWQDDEGNTPLHIACMFGQSEVVEVVSLWLSKLEDFYIVNSKNYTPAHVATTADVLRKLYEFGVDLWVADTKGRYPLFMNSFQGRVDCVTLLIEFGIAKRKDLVCAKDKQGDSALHVACMCGHFACVVLLLYWLSNDANKQGLTPHTLAVRTNHANIASLVEYVEGRRANGESSETIFQCSFDSLAAVTLTHGSRWTKLYDHINDSLYYYDRVLLVSQWDRPQTYDEDTAEEEDMDNTREILRQFYWQYNQNKLETINDILHVYKGNFADLFLQLAERYQVQDLSIFSK